MLSAECPVRRPPPSPTAPPPSSPVESERSTTLMISCVPAILTYAFCVPSVAVRSPMVTLILAAPGRGRVLVVGLAV